MTKRGEFFLLSNPIFLGGLVLALAIILFAVPNLDDKLLSGNAVAGEDYIGIIGGQWEVNETFDARGCEEPKPFMFSYTAEMIQSGDRITFVEDSSNRKMELTGYLDDNRLPLEGRFTLTEEFLEDTGDSSENTGEVFGKIDLNLEISSDCKTLKGKGDWIAASDDSHNDGGGDSCLGFSDLTATRIDGRNCEGVLTGLAEKVPDFSGEWDFKRSIGKGDPFSMTFYQDGKNVVITSVGGTYNPPFDVSGAVKDNKLGVSGNLRGASGQSVIEFEFSDAILDPTCNSMDITTKWTTYRTVVKFGNEEDDEAGTSFYTATRVNPVSECKYIGGEAPTPVKEVVNEPVVEEPVVIEEPVVEEKPTPSPLPDLSSSLLILMLVLLVVIIAIAYLLVAITGKKRKLAKDLEMIVGKINENLEKGDRQGALFDYDVLTKQFDRVKDNLSGRDKKRIYELSIKAHERLSLA